MDHGVTVAFEHGLQQAALGRIVVDDQNGLGHGASLVITEGPPVDRTGPFRDDF